jgi:hypothetical protein
VANTDELYWGVVRPTHEVVFLYAAEAKVDNGVLAFFHSKGFPVVVYASGAWTSFYAASVMDGSAVAVDHIDFLGLDHE